MKFRRSPESIWAAILASATALAAAQLSLAGASAHIGQGDDEDDGVNIQRYAVVGINFADLGVSTTHMHMQWTLPPVGPCGPPVVYLAAHGVSTAAYWCSSALMPVHHLPPVDLRQGDDDDDGANATSE